MQLAGHTPSKVGGHRAKLVEECRKPILGVLLAGVAINLRISAREPAWPSGKTFACTSVRFRFGFPFSEKVVVYEHCLGTVTSQ